MRVFAAIEMEGELAAALEESIADIASCVAGRPTPPENLHVTLAFMGDLDDGQVSQAREALDAACSTASEFDATLGALGHFGDEADALLWQGFEDASPFEELAGALRDELAARGLPFDDKPFVPHVTLMRRADIRGDFPLPYGETDIVSKAALFATHFIDGRPSYELLHVAPLGKRNRRQEGKTLFIDADACPVTAEALFEARKARVPVVIVGNTTQNLSRHIRKDDSRDPRKGFWIEVLEVGVGPDAADFAITQLLRTGDVVVTQDIGLAAMVIGAGASAIGVRGHVHTLGNIDLSLEIRHQEKKLRRAGTHTAGPSAFTEDDRQRFKTNLRRLLQS